MRKYEFNLQPVLNHRETVEDIKRREHIAAQQDLSACTGLIDGLRREIGTVMSLVGPTSGVEERIRRDEYVAAIERRIERLADDRSVLETRLEAARLALVAASQSRKAIERVQQRDLDNWRVARSRAEQADLDEIAISRYGRNKAEN